MVQPMTRGPQLNKAVPAFQLPDHQHNVHDFAGLIGRNGALLGFAGDIWQPMSMRRIVALQRHACTFDMMGVNIVLVMRDSPHTLNDFRSSSPLPLPFPLLADTDGYIHLMYGMDHEPGLLLVDRSRVLRRRWLVTENAMWPSVNELVHAAQQL
jgi:peroxiredoxin